MKTSLSFFCVSWVLWGVIGCAPAPQPAPDAGIALKNGAASLIAAKNTFASPATSSAPPTGGVSKPARNSGDLPLEAPDPLTPREKAPFLPPPQKQNGITLRVIDAGFASLAQLSPRSDKNTRPLFYFFYTLSGIPDDKNDKSGWGTTLEMRNTRLMRVSGPNGEPVARNASAPLQREVGVYRGMRLSFSGVNPAWKHVVAEFEILDPQAPSDAAGEFNSTLTFAAVPLPPKTERGINLGREMTTARGTKITLQSLRADKPGSKGSTYFVFAVTPPASVPDMQVGLDINGVKNQDGEPWRYSSWGSGGTQLHVDGTPREGDTSLTLNVKVKESAPSLQQRRWFRRFRTEIPVAALFKIAPPALTPSASLWKVEGRAVTVEIEPENLQADGNWDGFVWIKNRVPSADKTQRWLLREVTAHAAGQETRGWLHERDYYRHFMRLNGTVAATEEHPTAFTLPFFARPAKFDLEMTLELARRLESFTELRRVPLPPPGASLDFRRGKFENGTLRIRRLFWFKNASELAGLSPNARASYQNENLAIVVEILPVFPGAATNTIANRIRDDAGRNLNAHHWRGDATRSTTENTNLVTLLLQASSHSKTLDFWFNTVETKWSGQSENLVMEGLAGK